MKLMVATLLVVALGASAVPPRVTDRPTVPASSIQLVVPASSVAGTRLPLMVSAEGADEVTVMFTNGYRTVTQVVRLDADEGNLEAPLYEFAGRLDIVALAADRFAAASVEIVPAAVDAPPTPLVGARSIVADGADRTMVVLIPSDEFGNAAAPGTEVEIDVIHPDRSIRGFSATVDNSLAWRWVPSVTTAGVAAVSAATVDGPASADKRLVEIPGRPVGFGLSVATERRPADGATLVTVVSDEIHDINGNVMVDGTAALVRADYPDGTVAFQTVATVRGVAVATIEAPTKPGIVRVQMFVVGVTGEPLPVDFAAAVAPGEPVRATARAATITPEVER
ncbi:MAG: hypothetical protein OEQ47_14775 [Acidimicrobiia bacterium]|nr:hypothetical protein [Acidimicrobiia bacterium]